MVRCLKCLVRVTLGLVFFWACVDGFVQGTAGARQAEVHKVKITQHVTFSPLVLQMRSGDRIQFCDESGLYIKPYYFPFDGPHAPPNDLVRLGTVPPHQCMTTEPIILPQDSKGRRVHIFSEIQNLQLVVGLYPDEPGPVPPLSDDPYLEEPILGSWKGCDGRVIKFSEEGDSIIGHYAEIAGLGKFGFKKNDVSHRLARSGPKSYTGRVVWKFVKTTPSGNQYSEEERTTTITVQEDQAHDSGADSCGQNLIRISM